MGRKREILIVLLSVIMRMMVFGGAGANFQMFQLVEQWPPAYCATHPTDCNVALAYATTRFTIHGYWPSHDDGTTEIFCPTHNLTHQEITGQEARLNTEWITFRQNWSNFQFWSREWTKHGSCSGLVPSRYFETALHFKQQYNLYSILGRLAPTTTFTKRVTLNQLQVAIYPHTQSLPGFYCTRDPHTGYREITEVVLCVTRGGPTTYGALQNCSDAVTEQTCSFNHTYFWRPEKEKPPTSQQALLHRFFGVRGSASAYLCFVVVVLLFLVAARRVAVREKLLQIFHRIRTARAPVKED